MPIVKKIEVREELAALKRLYRQVAYHLKPRLKMLIIACEEGVHSQRKLAERLKVDPNSVKAWKSTYAQSGLDGLLQDSRTGNYPSVIDQKTHEALQAKLTHPTEALRSYKELQQWVDEQHLPGIHYQTLRGYVKRHFSTKIKVVRKSHIGKDPQAVEQFKKKSPKR
jgi:transposase